MPYGLPGTFVDGSTTVPVGAANLNLYTAAVTDLDLRAPIRGSFTNPNGNVTGSPGNTYSNTVGGTGITLWIKESGSGTTSGWVAVSPGSGGGVPTSRLITTGTGLSGGGDLTADRTLSVTADTTTQRIELAKAGTLTGTRKRLNLIEGANVTITAADNSGSNQLDVTIASSGGSGSPDATTTSKGIIQLAGDLGGTAAAPTVPVRSVAGRTGAITLTKTDVGLSNVANVDAIPKNTVTTFGDLLGVTFGGALTRTAVGADGLALFADSGETAGYGWQPVNIPVNTVGVGVTPRPALDFWGTGAVIADDGVSRTRITISGSKTAPTPEAHNLVSWSADFAGNNSATAPVAGTIYLTKLLLPSALPSLSLTTIYWYVQGAFSTPANNFIGIYNPNGTRLLNVATDTDLTTAGLKATTFSAVSVTGLPFIWVGQVFNAGTINSIGRSGNTATVLNNIGLSAATYRSASNGTSATSLPASITPASNVSTLPLWLVAVA